jgi:hypothetical protein
MPSMVIRPHGIRYGPGPTPRGWANIYQDASPRRGPKAEKAPIPGLPWPCPTCADSATTCRGVPMGSFAATGSVIHVISPPESGRAER